MSLDGPHPGGRVNSQSGQSLSRVAGVGSLGTGGFRDDAVEKPACLLPPATVTVTVETAWSFPAYPTLPLREAFLCTPHPALTMAYSASPPHECKVYCVLSHLAYVLACKCSHRSQLCSTGVSSER